MIMLEFFIGFCQIMKNKILNHTKPAFIAMSRQSRHSDVTAVADHPNADDNSRIDNTSKWLKSIFKNMMLLPVNIISLVIALVLNAWLLVILGDIIYRLFILGHVPKDLWDTIFDFFEIIPIILTVDLFWSKGYLIRDVIAELDFDLITTRQIQSINIVFKLIVLIVICLAIHIIGYITFEYRLRTGYTFETKVEYFGHLPHRVVNTFLIPVYITFASAIHFKYKQMNDFIKQLVNTSEAPELMHLREIKCLFKTNAKLISRVNNAFNLVMTTFFIIILVGIIRDSFYTFYAILAYISFTKSTENGEDLTENDIIKQMVRCISADIVVIGMKLLLIGATVGQMLAVNYESRATPIHFNDMFSQFEHIIQPVLYRSFRLLKYYMKSRLEKTDRPALLNITLLSSIPALRSRLTARMGY
ncbi:unnamed protein product [Medioppia subpectinata]|uniref:Uncharacterized protein n=1 Tax=Medioppia subpectinata TaxID=1979941 RepID=A0A7R9KT93_9ACAR|nr:unnamed protein product [Medioppia subpectinata]CAG2109316.1 unnamed protein product [Medioppia subpectinata]